LSISSDDFESLWVEIEIKGQANILCAVFYRHPHGSAENFMNNLNANLQKINREKKYCLIMGDFNLDLLKYENHQDTNNFINTMSSFFFHPQILQPTRNTDHSATLIDFF
jgi:hypothetical protein